jgi:hypothetical protein
MNARLGSQADLIHRANGFFRGLESASIKRLRHQLAVAE